MQKGLVVDFATGGFLCWRVGVMECWSVGVRSHSRPL